MSVGLTDHIKLEAEITAHVGIYTLWVLFAHTYRDYSIGWELSFWQLKLIRDRRYIAYVLAKEIDFQITNRNSICCPVVL